MDSLPLIVLAAILIVGVVFLAGITTLNKKRSGLDHAFFQKQWQMIESYKQNGGAGLNLAIFEADKLLDLALKNRGFPGDTMGDRLKSANRGLSNINAVWDAHKLRNRLAHEQNVALNTIVVERALHTFKAALKELGAL